MKYIVDLKIATAHNTYLESMKTKTADPNEDNTQSIENEAIKTTKTVEILHNKEKLVMKAIKMSQNPQDGKAKTSNKR